MIRWIKQIFSETTTEMKVGSPQSKNRIERQSELAAALHQAQVSDFYYNIEVAGGCNLRCPSCAVGNTFTGGPPKTLMTIELFSAILDKIRVEQTAQGRSVICLDFYNWGEPLLHNELPQLISIAKDRAYKVGLSSNLNHGRNLEEVIKAGPGYLRVSLSGWFQHTYARTHKGGNIEVVKENMRRLREYIDRHQAPTIVEVGYITYRHNCGEELSLMADFCDELDFKFSKNTAALMPVEKLMDSIETQKVPDELRDLLPIDPATMANLSRPFRNDHMDCSLRRGRMTINADGSVPLCCAVWSKEYDVAKNYLETAESEIQKARYAHGLCKRCMSTMADFTYNGIYVEPVMEKIRAAIGS